MRIVIGQVTARWQWTTALLGSGKAEPRTCKQLLQLTQRCMPASVPVQQ
jgi:hypothetical protein